MIAVAPTAPQHRPDVAVDRFDFPEGDLLVTVVQDAVYYHTGKERAFVGIVKVIAEAHPDSTDLAWRSIDVAAVEPLPAPVGLDRIKADKRFAGMALVKLPRLSVQPVTDAEWRLVCQMGGRDSAHFCRARSRILTF